ncbi:MAG: T9SS C-terminal target domain-containing protein, partial [Bacteroidetes bacterium]
MLLLLGLAVTPIKAQTSINGGGGNATGSSGNVSYSIGQTFYTAQSGATVSSTQGVQQPYEISITSGLKETLISLNLSVYPNPATDELTLKLDKTNGSGWSYQLLDATGKLVKSQQITGKEEKIIMANLAAAHYFLRVLDGNKEVKTFK